MHLSSTYIHTRPAAGAMAPIVRVCAGLGAFYVAFFAGEGNRGRRRLGLAPGRKRHVM